MKKVIVFALALVLAGGVAYANFCARDTVPASTLLVPWGAVDLDASGNPTDSGWTTLFAVTNVSADAILVHFTLWDIQSNHVVDFDEVLTGYDVWTMNFRDLLRGRFDLFDTGSNPSPTPIAPPPYGPLTNGGFNTVLPAPTLITAGLIAGCNFPYGSRTSLGPIIVGKLQAAMTANTNQSAACKAVGLTVPSAPWLKNLASNPVWFYLTADVVAKCNTSFPDETGYWSGCTAAGCPADGRFPIAKNVIVGDIFWMSASANYSDSVPAVSIEADPQAANVTLNAFYDRYSKGLPLYAGTKEDDREPLPTAWAFRYLNNDGVKTNAVVWKNTKEIDMLGDVDACLNYVYYAWDESEHAKARGGGGPSGFDTAEPNNFPFESQSVPVDQATFAGLPANNGWMLLVFRPATTSTAMLTQEGQSWVGVRYILPGVPANYSTALEAAVMANAFCFPTQYIPQLGVNFNYTDGNNVPARW